MVDWITNLDFKIQSALISALVSLLIFLVGWVLKFVFERFSINFRLKREYYFEQRKRIKEQFVITKTSLLKATEDINFRLHNLRKTILEQNLLNIVESDWSNSEQYYLHSTIYRFSVFYHWLLEVEKSLYNLDTVNAERHDKIYIKYIKALKQILTDNRLLEDLGYKEHQNSNHFYANEISKYAKLCLNDTGDIVDFDIFQNNFASMIEKNKKFIKYFASVDNDISNLNYSALKCLHIITIDFLNKFGHEYQKTKRGKYKALLKEYNDLKIKKGFLIFLDRNKLINELRFPLRNLSMDIGYRFRNRNKEKI